MSVSPQHTRPVLASQRCENPPRFRRSRSPRSTPWSRSPDGRSRARAGLERPPRPCRTRPPGRAGARTRVPSPSLPAMVGAAAGGGVRWGATRGCAGAPRRPRGRAPVEEEQERSDEPPEHGGRGDTSATLRCRRRREPGCERHRAHRRRRQCQCQCPGTWLRHDAIPYLSPAIDLLQPWSAASGRRRGAGSAEALLVATTVSPGVQPTLARVVEEAVARVGADRSRLLDVAREVQARFHCVSPEASRFIARALGLPRVDVDALVSFYSFLSSKPLGRHVLRLSDCPSCRGLQGPQTTKALELALGGGAGPTTADGRLTLARTSCIGMCGHGPTPPFLFIPLPLP